MPQKKTMTRPLSYKQSLSGKIDSHLHQVVTRLSEETSYSFSAVTRHLYSFSAAGVTSKENNERVRIPTIPY